MQVTITIITKAHEIQSAFAELSKGRYKIDYAQSGPIPNTDDYKTVGTKVILQDSPM